MPKEEDSQVQGVSCGKNGVISAASHRDLPEPAGPLLVHRDGMERRAAETGQATELL